MIFPRRHYFPWLEGKSWKETRIWEQLLLQYKIGAARSRPRLSTTEEELWHADLVGEGWIAQSGSLEASDRLN